MIDPDELTLRAVAQALDESGLAPSSSVDDANAFIVALWEHGYTVTKREPVVPDKDEEEE